MDLDCQDRELERETYEAAFNEGGRRIGERSTVHDWASLEGDGLLVVLPLLQALPSGPRGIPPTAEDGLERGERPMAALKPLATSH